LDKVEFTGYIPDLAAAFRVSGSRDGGRIMIDFPETEVPKALPLLLLRGQALRIIAEPLDRDEARRR
jgi:hypothetical protein